MPGKALVDRSQLIEQGRNVLGRERGRLREEVRVTDSCHLNGSSLGVASLGQGMSCSIHQGSDVITRAQACRAGGAGNDVRARSAVAAAIALLGQDDRHDSR